MAMGVHSGCLCQVEKTTMSARIRKEISQVAGEHYDVAKPPKERCVSPQRQGYRGQTTKMKNRDCE